VNNANQSLMYSIVQLEVMTQVQLLR